MPLCAAKRQGGMSCQHEAKDGLDVCTQHAPGYKLCRANTSGGRPCKKLPRRGYEVCDAHGAGTVAAPGGRPPVHGLRGMELHRLSKKGRERIQSLQSDPDLFDSRRPAAVLTFLMESMDDPDSEKFIAAARDHAQRKLKGKEPTDADMVLARNELITLQAGVAERLMRSQESAVKQKAMAEMLLAALLPRFEQASTQLRAVVDRHVPEERRSKARAEVRDIFAALAGGILEVKAGAGR